MERICMNSRIGILGGTFNPVHLGHLLMAQDAMEAFELTKVLFMPCARPPHKDIAALAPVSHRVAMLELAIKGNLDFELCDMEIKRGGSSYTVDSIRALLKKSTDTDYFFIIGSDTLTELHLWKEIGELLGLCRIVTVARPGVDLRNLSGKDMNLPEEAAKRLLDDMIEGHLVDVSSSDIRYRVAEGMRIHYLTPSAVEMHIAEHGLYSRL